MAMLVYQRVNPTLVLNFPSILLFGRRSCGASEQLAAHRGRSSTVPRGGAARRDGTLESW